MTKSITISLADDVIASAERSAREEGTTLDELIHRWLTDYAEGRQSANTAMRTVRDLRSRIDTSGHKFTREEMNDR